MMASDSNGTELPPGRSTYSVNVRLLPPHVQAREDGPILIKANILAIKYRTMEALRLLGAQT